MKRKTSRVALSLLLVLCMCYSLVATAIPALAVGDTTVQLIEKNSTWKFDDSNTDLGTAWSAADYDDSTWKTGAGPLGYPGTETIAPFGKVGDGTTVANANKPNAFITYYFRNTFDLAESDLGEITQLDLTVGYDDGYVMYINGTEVRRDDMPGDGIGWDTFASAVNEGKTITADITAAALSYLTTGTNTIAVEVHNRDHDSSDIYFDMELTATLSQSTQQQAAPEGLAGVAPTSDATNDGMITGTTTDMEYMPAGESSWTACTGTEITGLAAGEYVVRYAATESLEASPVATVTVPAYVAYEASNITFQPGSNDTIMNFTWYSNVMSSTQSVVEVALSSDMAGAVSFTGTIVDSNGFKSNEVSVTGLSADTTYFYRLGDGTSFSEVYSFKTHNLSDGYNAILVGDPQIGSGGYLNGMDGWKNTVTKALTQFTDTSFILSAGDQVNTSTSEAEYNGFFSPEELTSMPLIPAVGNHDNNSLYAKHYNSPNESSAYGTTSAGGDYWFTYGNTLYMVLNSNTMSVATHDAFMKEAIESAGSGVVWKVVMFHHSIYSSASHSTESTINTFRNNLYPVMDKYDIDVVLAGHDHDYTRTFQMEGGVAQNAVESSVTNPVGTLYITANSGSGSKYYELKSPNTSYEAARWQGKVPSYSNLEVTNDSFTITTYRSDDGSVIDTYTITKDQSGAPAGLVGVEPTTIDNNDGKITGTTAAMEYKLTTQKTWTACADGETLNMLPGVYDVRYGGAKPSVSTIVTINAFVVNQDQDAPAGLTGVTPTTADNNDGQITGTTTAMEYKMSSDSSWTDCAGTVITNLVPGNYDVRYKEKTGYNASPATTVTVPVFGIIAISSRISTGLDDMEERPDGSLDHDSSDLEITREKSENNQKIGLRFADLQIPEGAVIVDAYIQFSVDEPDKNADPFNVNIYTENTVNSAPFENASFTVSSRVKSVSNVVWKGIPQWTIEHAAGADQRTPNLSSLMQEIVNMNGWAQGNAISFIMIGNGQRSAESYEGSEGNTAQIPTLYVKYTIVDEELAAALDALKSEIESGKYTYASVSTVQLVVDEVNAAIMDGSSSAKKDELLAKISGVCDGLVLINQAKLTVAPNTILGSDRLVSFYITVDQLQGVDVMEGLITMADEKFVIADIESLYSGSNFIFTKNLNYSGDTAYFSLAQVGGFADAATMDVVKVTVRLKSKMTAESLTAALDAITMYFSNSKTHTVSEIYSAVAGDGTVTTNIWMTDTTAGNDLSLAMSYFGAMNTDDDWSTSGADTYDVNNDGVIDISDLTIIALLAAKIKVNI